MEGEPTPMYQTDLNTACSQRALGARLTTLPKQSHLPQKRVVCFTFRPGAHREQGRRPALRLCSPGAWSRSIQLGVLDRPGGLALGREAELHTLGVKRRAFLLMNGLLFISDQSRRPRLPFKHLGACRRARYWASGWTTLLRRVQSLLSIRPSQQSLC